MFVWCRVKLANDSIVITCIPGGKLYFASTCKTCPGYLATKTCFPISLPFGNKFCRVRSEIFVICGFEPSWSSPGILGVAAGAMVSASGKAVGGGGREEGGSGVAAVVGAGLIMIGVASEHKKKMYKAMRFIFVTPFFVGCFF